ncbi:hypothetical protein ABN763_18735 [Spongiivirga sp. MCCC 1A20706]|uniref:hypothetical protein n=1 Tax=Spongiivirga sp. MCCC 1A20706 TaxID=3160963 RepID=UPI0039773EE8
MKIAAIITKSIGIFAMLFSASQCGGYKLEKKAPMTMDVSCQQYTGGQPGSGGLNIYFVLPDKLEQNVRLDSVYFRGRLAKLSFQDKTKYGSTNSQYLASFPQIKKPDIISSANPADEVGNKPPKAMPKIPFELEKDQCVISYQVDGKTKYYKIDNIKEKEMLIYPSSKPQRGNK